MAVGAKGVISVVANIRPKESAALCAAALKGEPVPPDPSADEQRKCLLWHYDLCRERFGEQKESCWFSENQ